VILRWLKFNAVGAVGLAVQLGVLWLLERVAGVQYLLATVLAVEAAVLHNFVWHQLWTWRGRLKESAWVRLLRFHLANGLVSLVANFGLMALFVGGLHMRVMPANLLSVGLAGLLNFALAEVWVFGRA
jgi:putative flippase GtrA